MPVFRQLKTKYQSAGGDYLVLPVGEAYGQVWRAGIVVAYFGPEAEIRKELEVESAADVEDAGVGGAAGSGVGLAETGESATGDEVRRNGKTWRQFKFQSGSDE